VSNVRAELICEDCYTPLSPQPGARTVTCRRCRRVFGVQAVRLVKFYDVETGREITALGLVKPLLAFPEVA